MSKAIIIGSGMGGLATALRLAYQGFDVSVFEKQSHPGGRSNLLADCSITTLKASSTRCRPPGKGGFINYFNTKN